MVSQTWHRPSPPGVETSEHGNPLKPSRKKKTNIPCGGVSAGVVMLLPGNDPLVRCLSLFSTQQNNGACRKPPEHYIDPSTDVCKGKTVSRIAAAFFFTAVSLLPVIQSNVAQPSDRRGGSSSSKASRRNIQKATSDASLIKQAAPCRTSEISRVPGTFHRQPHATRQRATTTHTLSSFSAVAKGGRWWYGTMGKQRIN